jgi:hypothetical protein
MAKNSHLGTWIASVVAGLIVIGAIGLAGLIVFGTASRPPPLTSVSDPMRHINFSDMPSLQQEHMGCNDKKGRLVSAILVHVLHSE